MKGKETLREIEFDDRKADHKRSGFNDIKHKLNGKKSEEHFNGKDETR